MSEITVFMEFKTDKGEMSFRKKFRANSDAIIRIAHIISEAFDLYSDMCPEEEN